MGVTSFAYKLFFLLHLATIIIGFGSTFVFSMLGGKAKRLGPTEPKQAYAISHAAYETGKVLASPFIYAAGAFGLVLVVLSDSVWKFSQTWISAAFVLFIAAALIAIFLHNPNLKAMDELSRKLADGDVKPNPGGGPPKEVAELEERGGKAGMYGGVLHLMWLLLMIDMIWKPGMQLAGL